MSKQGKEASFKTLTAWPQIKSMTNISKSPFKGIQMVPDEKWKPSSYKSLGQMGSSSASVFVGREPAAAWTARSVQKGQERDVTKRP